MIYQLPLEGTEAMVSYDYAREHNCITIMIPKRVFMRDVFPDKVLDVILVCEKNEVE